MIVRESKSECREVTLWGDPNPDDPDSCEGMLDEETLEINSKCQNCSLYFGNDKHYNVTTD